MKILGIIIGILIFFSPIIYYIIKEIYESGVWRKGNRNCIICNGSGKTYQYKNVECYDCDGTGKIILSTWLNNNGENVKRFAYDEDDRPKVCRTCYGQKTTLTKDYLKGEIECYKCKGKGTN